MTFLGVDGPNALFEAQERLVNLCSPRLPILRVVDAVGRALAACEVDQEELAALFDTLLLDLDLANGVTAA